MKEILYKINSAFISNNWDGFEKIKALIETNDYFTSDEWTNILSKNKYYDQFEIKYFRNKYEGYKLVKNADILFSFGDNKYYDKTNLKMLYYGISQPDINEYAKPTVYYAKGFSSQSIAEYCLAYSLIMINNYDKYFKHQSKKNWKQSEIRTSNAIAERAIGILGLGYNGRNISKLFRQLGCKVYGYDINKDNANIVDVFCDSFEDLLKASDILIISVNLTPDTKNMFNINSLSLMKESAILINVSRGGIVKEDDLFNVLKDKKLHGAVLDVTVDEPLSRYSKLWELENLIITPHVSGNINKYYTDVMNDFSSKLSHFIDN